MASSDGRTVAQRIADRAANAFDRAEDSTVRKKYKEVLALLERQADGGWVPSGGIISVKAGASKAVAHAVAQIMMKEGGFPTVDVTCEDDEGFFGGVCYYLRVTLPKSDLLGAP